MDTNNDREIVEEIEILDKEVESNFDNTPVKKKSKPKKTKRKHGTTVVAGFLVFGMAFGSVLTITVMKDSIINEVTKNVQDSLSVPANSSNDSTISSVSASPNNTASIVEAVTPSVVSIGILGTYSDSTIVGAGTGVIYDEDDEYVYIVTNNHVIDGASGVKVWLDGSDEAVNASLLGTKSSNDLAIIYISKEDLSAIGIDEVTPCTFGDSDELKVGDSVLKFQQPSHISSAFSAAAFPSVRSS